MKVPNALDESTADEVVDEVGSDDLGNELGNEELGSETETTEVEAPSYLDTEASATQLVRIKVDGEEVEVPLSEALAGYSRQSHFTKGMQDLAAQREQVQFGMSIEAALKQDPHTAIAALMARYAPEDTPTFEDPLEAKVYALEHRLSQQDANETSRSIQNEVATLEAQYGDDFDFYEARKLVLSGGAQTITAAHKMLAFDKYVTRDKAKAEADAKRTAAKRSQGVSSTGSGRGSVSEKPVEHKTFREQLIAEMRIAGYDV